jgi:hypothetical protein
MWRSRLAASEAVGFQCRLRGPLIMYSTGDGPTGYFGCGARAPAEPTTTAAVELDGLADYVGPDAKAIEFDLVLPIVAGGHGFGSHGAAGLDVLNRLERRRTLSIYFALVVVSEAKLDRICGHVSLVVVLKSDRGVSD